MAEIFTERRPTLSVEFLSDDPLPSVMGDESMLKFVVVELMKNALEAIPGNLGKVTISLKNQSAKGKLQMLIRDTGQGIPEHLQPRLFQPFFTTKEHRQGLSLSRAKRYVEFHGGTLELISTSAQGTTFQLELPLGTNGGQ
jgi:signal transduction histidine kinase